MISKRKTLLIHLDLSKLVEMSNGARVLAWIFHSPCSRRRKEADRNVYLTSSPRWLQAVVISCGV